MMLACDRGASLGSRVAYEMYEAAPYPLISSSVLIGGFAGSCMPGRSMAYSAAQSLKWSPDTNLEVHAYWPDRTDCTGLLNPVCPAVKADVATINSAWDVLLTPGVAAEVIVAVKSVRAGGGGFGISANGVRFSPDFVLSVDNAAAIWFERANGRAYNDVIPGPISQLNIAAGKDASVAVTLHSAGGEHICGPVPAVLTLNGTVVSLDRFIDGDYVNVPYHIIAGSALGSGSMQLTVGGITASLPIVVQ